MKKVLLMLIVVAVLTTAIVFAQGEAETYPSKTIELVVPSSAGGGQDTLCRWLQPRLEKELGVNIRVSNVSGGAHVKGIVYAHSAPADGYTIHCESPSGIIADVFNKMDFKFTEEFVPVARFQKDNGMLWIGADSKFKNIDEVIAYAKANPNKVSVAIASPGGVDDAGVGTFARLAGISLAIVPMEEAGERMASVIAGHVDMMYEEVSAVGDMMESGKLKPVLLFGTERIDSPDLADVPCTNEYGFEGMEALGTWRGFAVRKGTPQEYVDRLEQAFKAIYDSPEYKEFEKESYLDLTNGWMGQKEFKELWNETFDLMTDVFKELGRI